MDMGKRIKEARKQAGLTQKELAQKLGLATGTVQQYELNKRSPRIEQLKEIASVLDVTLEYLLGHENIKTKKVFRAVLNENGKELEDLLGLDPGSIVSFYEKRDLKKRYFRDEKVEEILEKLDKLKPEAQILVFNQHLFYLIIF